MLHFAVVICNTYIVIYISRSKFFRLSFLYRSLALAVYEHVPRSANISPAWHSPISLGGRVISQVIYLLSSLSVGKYLQARISIYINIGWRFNVSRRSLSSDFTFIGYQSVAIATCPLPTAGAPRNYISITVSINCLDFHFPINKQVGEWNS